MARGTRLEEGRARVVIEGVAPEMDGAVSNQAGAWRAGPGAGGSLRRRTRRDQGGGEAPASRAKDWTETPMEPLVEDRWRVSFEVLELGEYLYTIEGWVDAFATWRRDLEKKFKAGLDIDVELVAGAELMESAAANAEIGGS